LSIDCQYCGKPAEKRTGKQVYPRRPELSHRFYWVCDGCEAYVGCYGKTDKPMGILANAALRAEKQIAHAAFDPIWKRGYATREQAYAWLALKLGLPQGECHIGTMQMDMCEKVVAVSRKKLRELEDRRNNPKPKTGAPA
jgi:hypothetical protein